MYAWTEAMSVGVREFDAQHRRLFALINGILDAAVRTPAASTAELRSLLDEFMEYHVFHNKNEERHMTEFGCADASHFETHALFHEDIMAIFEEAGPAVRDGLPQAHALCEKFARFAGDWYSVHIMTADKHYTRCFNDHDLF
jgi:hemerythrin